MVSMAKMGPLILDYRHYVGLVSIPTLLTRLMIEDGAQRTLQGSTTDDRVRAKDPKTQSRDRHSRFRYSDGVH